MENEDNLIIGGNAPLERFLDAVSEILPQIDWKRRPKQFTVECLVNLNDLPNAVELVAERLREVVVPAGFLHGLRDAVPKRETEDKIVIDLVYADPAQ